MSGWHLLGLTLIVCGACCLFFTLIAWLVSREYDQEMNAWRKRYPAPSLEDTIILAPPLQELPVTLSDDFIRKLMTVPLNQIDSVFAGKQ